MRAQRGRQALRGLLGGELRAEAEAYGLLGVDAVGWRETPLWCATCGARHLRGRFMPATGTLTLHCPACHPYPDATFVTAHAPALLRGVQGFKPALSRLMAWDDRYYRAALAAGGAPCGRCGRPAVVRMRMPETLPAAVRDHRGMHVWCAACGFASNISLGGLALWLPEGRGFWRTHPRIRTLPEREVETGGRRAIVSSLVSADGTARLDVVSAEDTYEVLHVHRSPAP